MAAALIRSQLFQAVQDAKATVERQPRPETYRALLEAQSELQRHDLEYGRPMLRSEPPPPRWPLRDAHDDKGE
jgi:hypothetical protein